MKLPILTRFGFNGNKATTSEKNFILNWYGIGAVTPQTVAFADNAATLDVSKGVNANITTSGDGAGADDELTVAGAKAGQSGVLAVTVTDSLDVLNINGVESAPVVAGSAGEVVYLDWYSPDGTAFVITERATV